jgi:uncharacterized membrane protein
MKVRALVPVLVVIVSFFNCSATLASVNPVPYIQQPLVPTAAAPGGAGFTLTINGSGFVASSIAQWNGSPRPTTYISVSQLTAMISASDVASASTASITVVNPTPGGGISNVASFQVTQRTSSVAYSSVTVSAGVGPSAATRRVVTGDFNGDGKQDIATLNTNDSVSILLGNGNGTFQPAVVYAVGSANTLALAAGDFNGDGKLDLAVSADPGGTQIFILPGNGNGTFGSVISPFSTANETTGSVFSAADLNGDGKLDLVFDCGTLGTANACVALGNGDGTFATLSSLATGSVLLSAAVGDFNGDGKLDLGVSYESSGNALLAVALGNGDGTFGTLATVDTIPLPTGAFNASLTAADVDGNGVQDLVLYFKSCDPPNPCSGNLQSYSGNGDGTFQPALPSLGAPVGDSNVLIGDFNADGILDIAVATGVLLGNGDGTFAANAVALPQVATAVGDFNGDGNLDFTSPANQAGVFVLLRVAPDFGGFSSPTSQTVVAGANTGYNIQVVPLYGWLNDVSLSVSGLPSGVTGSFQPVTVTGGNGPSVLSITTTAATAPGNYTLTLTGSAGTLSHSTTITLTVNPPSADFGGDITPGSQLVAVGQQANYAIQVVPFNGFTGDVTLSVTGLPAGSSFNFNPPVITGGAGTSQLTVVAPSSARSGAYIITITGTSGSLSHSGRRELDINTNADFTGSVTSIVSSVLPGQRASYAANVVSLNGFTGTVALSVSGLPAGAIAKFTPANVTGGGGASSLLVSTASTTPPGAYTLTITGASGSDVKSTTVPLLVNTSSGDFVGAISPSSQSVTAGGSASYGVTISALSGFTGNVTLSVTGVPPGASASFAPGNIISAGSGTANLTINTTGATPTGTYILLVTGTSGGLTHSGSVTLTVN